MRATKVKNIVFIIALIFFCGQSAWADQLVEVDEFCSPGARPPSAQMSGPHLCCEDSLCQCTSLICGGANVSLQEADSVNPPATKTIIPAPDTVSLLGLPKPRYTLLPSKVRTRFLDPPSPPPPQ